MGHAFPVSTVWYQGFAAAAAAMNSSTSALAVAYEVTKRINTPVSVLCSGQR
jgi:hypothetical protein